MFNRIQLFLLTLVFSQDYALVTFQVDMSNEVVSENGVYLMGGDETFLEFGLDPETLDPLPAWTPDAISLTDEDDDSIFEVSLLLLQNSSYLYKFINGNSFGQDESDNRSYLVGEDDEILRPVCFNSLEPCASFDGIPLTSLTFSTNLSNAIANNGFVLGDMLLVRWGYAETQLNERTDTLSAQGFGTTYSVTIDSLEVNVESGLFYQYYKIVDNIQYRENYFNFDFDGLDQNMAERRFFDLDGTEEGGSLSISDNINSNVDSRRMPQFMNTNPIENEIMVTWEVDMRPAFYQVYSGSTLYDIQGVVDVTSPYQVYELGVWMNGPATFYANGEDWTSWGAVLASTDSKKNVG